MAEPELKQNVCHLATNATNPMPACGVWPGLEDSVVVPLNPFDPAVAQITCLECAAIFLMRACQG